MPWNYREMLEGMGMSTLSEESAKTTDAAARPRKVLAKRTKRELIDALVEFAADGCGIYGGLTRDSSWKLGEGTCDHGPPSNRRCDLL